MGLIRLFLALVVAADHWWLNMMVVRHSIGFHDAYKFGFNAGYAVMFFYVISGFLITYTLMRNYRWDRSGFARFYRNRFIRIYSLYWSMVILMFVLVGHSWEVFLRADIWDKLTGIFLIGQDWRISFLTDPATRYSAAITGMQQSWTLAAELTFYVVAPFLMRSWKIGAALLLISFGVRACFVAALGTDVDDTWTYHFIVTTFGFFMLGHLACLLGKPLASPLIGIVLTVASFAVMYFSSSYGSFDTPRFWGSVLLFALALPGLFEATKNVRWMNLAGDLSYPIYLVHTGVLILVGPWLMDRMFWPEWLGQRPASYVTVAAFLATTMLASTVVHRLVEVPVARAMHMALDRWKVRPAE
jgi:peptidoglycan/LPS O-acetylase OafA/YrhL